MNINAKINKNIIGGRKMKQIYKNRLHTLTVSVAAGILGVGLIYWGFQRLEDNNTTSTEEISDYVRPQGLDSNNRCYFSASRIALKAGYPYNDLDSYIMSPTAWEDIPVSTIDKNTFEDC